MPSDVSSPQSLSLRLYGRLQWKGSVHEVRGTTRGLCGSEGPWLDDVASLPCGRPDGGRRCPWSSGDDGPDPCDFGASRSRLRTMGSGVAFVATGGPSSWGLQFKTSVDKSKVESFQPAMSSGMGHDNPLFCQGSGPDQLQATRSTTWKEAPKSTWRSCRRKGASSKAAAEVPEEAVCGGHKAVLKHDLSSDAQAEGIGKLACSLCSECVVSCQAEKEFKKALPVGPSSVVPGKVHNTEDKLPSWTSLQTFSFVRWTSSLCRKVLMTRTPFAVFLESTLHASRTTEKVSEKALFPLPIPKEGVFEGQTKCGSRCRRKRSFDQSFHVAIMALNFWHSDYRFIPLKELTKVPSSRQSELLLNLRKLFKAFGSCEEPFSVPSSGRRSTSLISQLSDLCEFLTSQGGTADSYFHGFPGVDGGYAAAKVAPDDDKAPELKPYRNLDASRLKLSGTASWDPTPFLSDDLWLAYVEPFSLRWRDSPEGANVPNLDKEEYSEVLALAKVWDVNHLLHLEDYDDGESRDTSVRFFNCYKNAMTDRMIGDRRAMNACEGSVPGASRALPTAMLLASLEVDAEKERLSICISDRKDFYHQFKVSPQRAASNRCFPPIAAKDLEGTFAFAEWISKKGKKKAYDRLQEGDFLGGRSRAAMLIPSEDAQVSVCFGSIPQGDHLGVEFAVDAHRSLLRNHGLLGQSEELRADRSFLGSSCASGLVIDDFYSVSVEKVGAPRESTPWAVEQINAAREVYLGEGLLGSNEKDVIDAPKAKVTGAELDSSDAVRKHGVVTLASPASKRLSLAFVSLELARLRYTTDSLHLCLVGGWVHSLLYRRPMMSILDKVFGFVDATGVEQEAPKVLPLRRDVAQELTMLAVLSPFMATDLTATMSSTIFATDSSDGKGAIVQAEVPRPLACALWRTGRKKGGFVRMMSKTEALLKKIDPDWDHFDEKDSSMQVSESVSKPLALRFHFIEVCGGAGKVSKYLGDMGWTIGPVIDLDRSEHFNLCSLRLMSWLLHLLEQGLLDSYLVQPPCTTFSPAQYPASRSYAEPRGYDPTEEKTLIGTTLALRALTLMYVASKYEAPGVLEQPKRTKMKRLEEWQFLTQNGLCHEETAASCMYGSIHLKEFVFLCCHVDSSVFHTKCSRDHEHVRVEGRFTKESATYVDGLAFALARCFDRALEKKLRLQSYHDSKPRGLENPLCNDALLSCRWKTVSCWRWKRPKHINVHETSAVLSLNKRLALSSPKTRNVVALDPNVGLCSLVKGRSSSESLRPVLRKVGATVVCGCLYPSYHFAPTRLNPSDHPTRDNEIPEALPSGLNHDASLCSLIRFAENECLTRPYANWVRLFTRVYEGPYPWQLSSESWRFAHLPLKHFPFRFCADQVCAGSFDFDQTKGYPGEGPWILCRSWIFQVFVRTSLALADLWTFFAHWIFSVICHLCLGLFLWILPWIFLSHTRSFHPKTFGVSFCNPWFKIAALLLLLGPQVSVAVSHGNLDPRDAGDKRRAAARGDLDLPAGRPVLGKTQKNRDKLLDLFEKWLLEQGFSLTDMLFVGEPDIEAINLQLERYGRDLFKAGRPYGHYAETINAVSGKRPRVRRALQPAWDLAYTWLRQEPPVHHIALPWQVLTALVATALSWGWPLVAGILALSWGGLTRIGEALTALRSQLVLPCDVEFTVDYVLLQINEPKTRFRAARHQVAKLDQPQLVRVVALAFQQLNPRQKLWPYSSQTMRTRFQKLLTANRLDSIPRHLVRGLDLGSLRAGGASWLMMVSEDSELTRRRGRWLTNKIMEIYVQEVSALQFMPHLPQHTKDLIVAGVENFSWILAQADDLRRAKIPENVWPLMLRDVAVSTERNGRTVKEEAGGHSTLLGRKGLCTSPEGMKGKRASWEQRCWPVTSTFGALISSCPSLWFHPHP